MDAASPNAMRSFDPRRVGELECAAWVHYYRREWPSFLRAAVALTRRTFALSWPQTLRGAWLMLRANQHWAPYPDNDPERARSCTRRCHRLVARHHGESFDVVEAARLEVEWWRVHRYWQRDEPDGGVDELATALAALYAHVYGIDVTDGAAPGASGRSRCATRTAGSTKAATRRARSSPSSARRSSAPTPRYWRRCTARTARPTLAGPS